MFNGSGSGVRADLDFGGVKLVAVDVGVNYYPASDGDVL
jgi:hypothetical protein